MTEPTVNLHPPPRRWDPAAGTVDTSGFRGTDDLRKVARESKIRHPEGYQLRLTEEQVELEVGGAAAVRYAWLHLQQLQGADATQTPCGVLEDHPAFGRRAFMLDISRCKVPNRKGFLQWLKVLAALRVNELQLYTEHTFRYPGHHQVWKDASPLNKEDIAWLQKEAHHLGIELVPNQNCFGHFERWIQHAPYRKYAESPDGFVTPWGEPRTVGSVLKPDDASFELVTGLLDELLPCFDSNRVNIGCDETFELGQGATRQRCRREGKGAVYAKFVNRIMSYVEDRHGMRPEFWGDILKHHPGEMNRVSRNAVGLCWGYEADSPLGEECRLFAESGLSFAVCPGTSSWRSFAGRTANMIQNLHHAAEAAFEWGAEGLLLTDWGDCGHLQQEMVSYGPMAFQALLAWSGPLAREEDAWAWCDETAFDGSAGDTACWLEAGRISEISGVHPGNSNLLFRWFQDPGTDIGVEVPTEKIKEMAEAVETLKSPHHFQPEWEQTLRNLRVSLALALDHREGSSTAPCLLNDAHKAHARLWRGRNRKGGLAESLEHYIKPVASP